MMKSGEIKEKWQYAILALGTALFALGVALCLTGAFLMWDGSILGENHASIATIVGIIGIGLIGNAGALITGLIASSARGKNAVRG